VFPFVYYWHMKPPVKRILLADDDPQLRALIRATLGHNYELSEAVDGEEAISTAYEVQPDLILVDADMPVFDGFEVSRTLRGSEATRAVPIVMLTGTAPENHASLGVAAGLTGYLRKPFSPSELLHFVEHVLETGEPPATSSFASADTNAILVARMNRQLDPPGQQEALGFAQTLSYARELSAHYESARRQAARFRQLVETARELVSLSEVEAVLSAGLDHALLFSEFENGSILLLEGTDGPLVVRVSGGLDQGSVGTVIQDLSKSIAGRAPGSLAGYRSWTRRGDWD